MNLKHLFIYSCFSFVALACQKTSIKEVNENPIASIKVIDKGGASAILSEEVAQFYPECMDMMLISEMEEDIYAYWEETPLVIDMPNPLILDMLCELRVKTKFPEVTKL